MGSNAKQFGAIGVALVLVVLAGTADALVTLTDPDDGSTFFGLFRPTGQFDETGLSGFEFLISSRTGEFRANDQYLISGEETADTTSIANDLGAVGDLSGVSLAFSIQHNLIGGRNFTFRLTEPISGDTSVLCWGQNCAAGSNSTPILNGIAPIHGYNGLQIQVRAQEVVGASAAVTITSLTGVDVAGADFFDEVVTPDVPGTILGAFDPGRRGQWMMADDLDLVLNEWELSGTVTLTRPDAALTDLTKVRLAVDFVRDPSLPFLLPEPSLPLLLALGMAGLIRRSVPGGGRRLEPSGGAIAGPGRGGSARARRESPSPA